MTKREEIKARLRKVLPWVGSFDSGKEPVHALADELAVVLADIEERLPAVVSPEKAATPVVEWHAKCNLHADCNAADEAVREYSTRLAALHCRDPKFMQGDCAKVNSQPPIASPEITTENLDKWCQAVSSTDTLPINPNELKVAQSRARQDIFAALAKEHLARQAEVDARERATDKARIAALESQLADERRQFAARRGELERDEAQVKLHSIDTAAGTWRPNAPADVNAICAKLAEGGKAALELARVRELAKHGYITGWSVMASDPRQVAELAELRKLLGMG